MAALDKIVSRRAAADPNKIQQLADQVAGNAPARAADGEGQGSQEAPGPEAASPAAASAPVAPPPAIAPPAVAAVSAPARSTAAPRQVMRKTGVTISPASDQVLMSLSARLQQASLQQGGRQRRKIDDTKLIRMALALLGDRARTMTDQALLDLFDQVEKDGGAAE
jgi:hypothetical protein